MNTNSPQFPISHVKVTNINDIPATDHRGRADYSIRKVNKLKTNSRGRTDAQETKESLSWARDVKNEIAADRKMHNGATKTIKIGNLD